jgi:hypothetical protein
VTPRGRPPGRLTTARRKALAYVERRRESGEPIVLGEMMRQCGFSCRSNAKRTLNDLKKIGAAIY